MSLKSDQKCQKNAIFRILATNSKDRALKDPNTILPNYWSIECVCLPKQIKLDPRLHGGYVYLYARRYIRISSGNIKCTPPCRRGVQLDLLNFGKVILVAKKNIGGMGVKPTKIILDI